MGLSTGGSDIWSVLPAPEMKAVFHGRGGKAPPAEALTPNSHQKQRMVSRGAKENVDPDSTGSLPENVAIRTPSATAKPPLAPKIRSPLHPRPLPNPNDTPLKKKKLSLETLSENGAPAAAATESGVQVRCFCARKEEDWVDWGSKTVDGWLRLGYFCSLRTGDCADAAAEQGG